MSRSAPKLLFIGLLVGLTTGLVAISPALAVPPSTCRYPDGVDYDVMARQGTQGGNQIGLKADTWLGTGDNDCARINSLNVINGNGFVEFGWILGWDACGSNGNNYQSTPRGFIAWQPINGSYHCEEVAGWAGGQFTNLAIRDENSNTLWGYYRDGSIQGTIDVNFDRGTAYTLGERKSTSDSAFAHYKNLKWMLAGQGGTWTNFSDLDPGPDDDPSYNCIHITNTEQKVQPLSVTCTD